MLKHDPGLFFTASPSTFQYFKKPRASGRCFWESAVSENQFHGCLGKAERKKRGKPANSDKPEHPKGSLFHTRRRFQRFPKTSTHAGGPKHSLTSSVIFTSLLSVYTDARCRLAFFTKIWNYGSVPGLRLLYQYGLFSNNASYFFSFPNCCYIIYKEITFDLFVAYMATDSWDTIRSTLRQVPLYSLWSPVYWAHYLNSLSNQHIIINYLEMTTFMSTCTFFQECIKPFWVQFKHIKLNTTA